MTKHSLGTAGRYLSVIALIVGLSTPALAALNCQTAPGQSSCYPVGDLGSPCLCLQVASNMTSPAIGSVCSTPIGECAANPQPSGGECGCHFGMIGTPPVTGTITSP